MTLRRGVDIIYKEFEFGGVAQLARAIGSYPVGHLFESDRRYQKPRKVVFARFFIVLKIIFKIFYGISLE